MLSRPSTRHRSSRSGFKLLLLSLLAAPLAAAEPHTRIEPDWFEFSVPSLATEATTGSPIDLSFLNPGPAGESGFLRPREDGEIVDGEGEVVKLFGTNLGNKHTMPPAKLARPMAQRLRQLGVNFLRLHMVDNRLPTGMIADDGETILPDRLDLFHRLAAELIEAGIYVDVNLHVARHYGEFPEGWSNWMGKGIDRVLPRLIESQERFARTLLLTPNPHRGGLSLAEDPGVAIVEINNENSLLRDGYWLQLAELKGEDLAWVQAEWNAFLADRYDGIEELRAAWDGGGGAEKPGPELLPDGLGERGVDASHGGEADFRRDGSLFRWTVRRPGEKVFSHQLHSGAVDAEDGEGVVLRLRYRGTEPVKVRLMNRAEPWAQASPMAELPASGDWQTHEIAWTVDNPSPEVPLRLSFTAENTAGVREIADLSLRAESVSLLGEGESLERGSVPIPVGSGNEAAMNNWRDFCTGLDFAYSEHMSGFLREELGVRAMILDTQAAYGGAPGLLREFLFSDVIDKHGYPTHPRHTEVDGRPAYRVAQRSMVADAFGSMPWQARWQVQGVPFGLTEQDLNPPQDFNSESYPILALAAAYQGWDFLGEFGWMGYQDTDNPTYLEHPYHTTGNPGQQVFMPAAALLFREQLVEPAGDPLVLRVHEQTLFDAGLEEQAMHRIWDGVGVGNPHAWRQRLLVDIVPGEGETTLSGEPRGDAGDVSEVVSDSGQIRFERHGPLKGTLAVNAPRVRLLIGQHVGRRFDLGGVSLEVTEGGTLDGDYANVALVSLDDAPIESATRLLLAQAARVHGEGMRFHDDADTLSTFGPGPMRAEPVGVRLELPGEGWGMTSLDGAGRPMGDPIPGPVFETGGRRSMWFLLERDAPRGGGGS